MRQISCPLVGDILRRDPDDKYAKLDYEGVIGQWWCFRFVGQGDLSEEVAMRIKKKEKNPDVQRAEKLLSYSSRG